MIDTNRPLRVLDRAIGGGLGVGNLGVIMSRHGTGKTAVLTSIALDHAMDRRNTLHVAVGKSVSDIRAYHDEVYQEIVKSLDLGDEADYLTVERHKQIYTYRNEALTIDRLRETLCFLRDHGQFVPELIELQGWPDFESGGRGEAETRGLKSLAEEFKTEIWLAAHTHRDDKVDERGVPACLSAVEDEISVLISLEEEADHMNLRFVKTPTDSGTNVKLEFDPKTMLIRWR